jgi:hypothetical protein
VLGLFYRALLCWAAGYWAAFVYRLFARFSVNRTEEPTYFGSTEPGTEQEPIFSILVLGSFGSVLGFLCPGLLEIVGEGWNTSPPIYEDRNTSPQPMKMDFLPPKLSKT